MYELLDRVPNERVLACIAIPPRHFKSTSAHHWIARLMERYGWMKVLYLSYGATFAAENAAAIQSLAVKCGVELGRVQRQDRWTTSQGGGLWSAGFDGQLTGRGFHLIVIDDPHKNRAEAESPTIRGKVNRSVVIDVLSRGQPDGPLAWPRGFPGTSVVVLATRWHEDDVTGNLIGTSPNAKPGARRFAYINKPAIDVSGEPLAPDFWTLEALQELRDRTPRYDWVSLYDGCPEPAGGRRFAGSVLVEREAIPLEGRFAIGVDLAHTTARRRDSHALCVMQRLGDEYWIRLVRSAKGRLLSSERDSRWEAGFVQEIRAAQRDYPGAATAQWIGGREDQVLDLLGALDAEDRVYIEPMRASTDKLTRWLPFQAAWNAGRIKIPRDAEWASDFVSRLISATGEEHEPDDEIDAASTAFDLLSQGDGVSVASPSARLETPRSGLTPRRRWS